jgi:hypothetical protein
VLHVAVLVVNEVQLLSHAHYHLHLNSNVTNLLADSDITP